MVCGFWDDKTSHDLYYDLPEEMINNEYEGNDPTISRRGIQKSKAPPTFPPVAHATPTKMKRKSTDGT